MELKKRICIAGAVESGRTRIALMLAEITGLKLTTFEHVDKVKLDSLIEGIVHDVASDSRADALREKGFIIIRYTNENCDKRVSIPLEEGDIELNILASDTPRKVYNKLVDIFEHKLIIRDEPEAEESVETTGTEDD